MVADNPEEMSSFTTDNTTIKQEDTSQSLPVSSQSVEEYRPLNVKDALTYLDKVKAKFSTQAEVYNQFLDIMKDFKSQMIDTPGVIERVSTLFRGHPVLISGFNTFLPPGYRIECSIDEQERNVIKVTTPLGTTSIKETEALHLTEEPEPEPSQPTTEDEYKAPVEFNHAITYVNKIKSHFSSKPDVYKKFLEVLQTYQKDQKPIEEVYSEVQILFNGSTELLDEFKQFLPEPKQRKKRLGNIPTLNMSKRTKHHHPADIQTSDIRSQLSTDDSPLDFSRPTFSIEEAAFFEKVKSYIGNKATYNAFLKVLNLFSQHIVDQNVLVSRVESFIGGNPELFELFKTLVGYDGDRTSQPAPQRRLTQPSLDCGPSYRHVAKMWENRTCSGRDALCWDVLNDTYVSHPTWASEDTGFVAAKKNQYEEALHRVEEERYDYDLNIEANLNTIALLEPIAKKLSLMTADQKAAFRITPSTLYQRILKKIYGPKGLDMIDLLHQNPAQTVSIVLKRLKQKDDEWKRAQREWNKIWREVEAKNYWKSLDYQGIRFKISDRKAMTTRALVAQAESLRAQALEPHFSFGFQDLQVFKDVSRLIYFYLERQPVYNPEDCASMKVFVTTLVPLFFEVSDVEPSRVEDVGIDELDDVSSVQSDDLKPPPVQTRTSKRTRRGHRLEEDGSLNQKTSSEDEEEDEEDEDEEEDEEEEGDDEEEEEDEEVNLSGRPRRRATRATSRRRQTKKSRQVKKKTPKIATLASLIEKVEPNRTFNFFGDSGFYCFFRLYQMLYERLCKMKSLDAEFKAFPAKAKKAREEAHDLGITPKRFKALNMDTKRGYYNILLSLIDKLFEGDIDQQTFEESVRYIFGADAYIMFTIDKLVLSVVRHIHIIIADTQSQELFELLQEKNKAERAGHQDLNSYRNRVNEILESENIYYINFKLKTRTLSIQLLDNDTSLNTTEENSGYDEYVTNYTDWCNETKGINQSALTPRFLKRNLKSKSNQLKTTQTKDISVQWGMQYKICRDTYHMFYIIGTEDAFIRHEKKPKVQASVNSKWSNWLNNNWSQGLTDEEKLRAEVEALNLLK